MTMSKYFHINFASYISRLQNTILCFVIYEVDKIAYNLKLYINGEREN